MSFENKDGENGRFRHDVELVSRADRMPRRPSGAINHLPSLGDYWPVLLRHKWTILSVTGVALMLGGLVSASRTKLYEAVGRIVINREGDVAGLMNEPSNGAMDDDYMVAMDTQVRILESDAIAKSAVRELNLDASPAFVGLVARPSTGQPSSSSSDARFIEPRLQAELVAKFHRALRVSSIPRTRLLEIGFTTSDPVLSAKAVNTLINIYVEQNYKTHVDATTHSADWLSQQLADLQTKVEESQEKLVRYQKEHEILGMDDKQNLTTSKLDQLNKEVTSAEADRIQKESVYRIAGSSASAELLASFDPASPLAKLRTQEEELHRQLAQASVRFEPTYPAVEELSKQLDSVQSDIKSEIARLASKYQKEYMAAVEHERLLRASLEQQKAEANQLNENAIQYSLLKRDVDSNRLLYDGLQQKLKEAEVMTGLRSSNVRIVDAASVPVAPSSPGFLHDLGLFLLIGLASGIALAFGLESRSDPVQSLDQAEAITGLSVLALIPLQSQSKRTRGHWAFGTQTIAMVTASNPDSEMAEAYRALRTSILLARNGIPAKVLMVTSALPQDGKTTTSVNLSIVLAQQGARVLLIEGDMRRASISAIFNFKSGPGLSTILERRADFEDALRAVPGVPTLTVLPAGPMVPYPSEMLASASMRDLISQAREKFDYVVLDSPPVLRVTDAVLLSTLSEATLLVARAGVTSKGALQRLHDVLAQVDANMIGVVLNATEVHRHDRYYYEGYRSKRSEIDESHPQQEPQAVAWSRP